MKKTLFLVLFAMVALIMTTGQAFAVAGQCSNCHTMHNSQNGAVVAAGTVYGDPAYPILLKGDCLGCHAVDAAAGAANIVTGMPQVAHNTTALAGGNFTNTNTDTTFGHNVAVLNAGDTILLGNVPPGGVALGAQLTCAGTNGCHGARAVANEMADLNGAHHANAGTTLNGATTVGNSYRFLLGVKGTEDADWQATTGAADHNEYFSDDPDAAGFGISKLCAKCHPDFHSTANTSNGTDWVRHPVEVAIGATYATNYTAAYDLTVPVGRTAVAAVSGVVGATDTVMCLSCHVAHAGTVADSLRWAVSTTGDGTGCNKCHAK